MSFCHFDEKSFPNQSFGLSPAAHYFSIEQYISLYIHIYNKRVYFLLSSISKAHSFHICDSSSIL